MAKSIGKREEDIAARGMRYTRDQVEDIVAQTGDYVRENPGQAMLYAFVAGYVLNRVPVRRILGGVLWLSLFALKPAVLMYGANKLYHVAQDEE